MPDQATPKTHYGLGRGNHPRPWLDRSVGLMRQDLTHLLPPEFHGTHTMEATWTPSQPQYVNAKVRFKHPDDKYGGMREALGINSYGGGTNVYEGSSGNSQHAKTAEVVPHAKKAFSKFLASKTMAPHHPAERVASGLGLEVKPTKASKTLPPVGKSELTILARGIVAAEQLRKGLGKDVPPVWLQGFGTNDIAPWESRSLGGGVSVISTREARHGRYSVSNRPDRDGTVHTITYHMNGGEPKIIGTANSQEEAQMLAEAHAQNPKKPLKARNKPLDKADDQEERFRQADRDRQLPIRGEVSIGTSVGPLPATPRIVGADNVARFKDLFGVCKEPGCVKQHGHTTPHSEPSKGGSRRR